MNTKNKQILISKTEPSCDFSKGFWQENNYMRFLENYMNFNLQGFFCLLPHSRERKGMKNLVIGIVTFNKWKKDNQTRENQL